MTGGGCRSPALPAALRPPGRAGRRRGRERQGPVVRAGLAGRRSALGVRRARLCPRLAQRLRPDPSLLRGQFSHQMGSAKPARGGNRCESALKVRLQNPGDSLKNLPRISQPVRGSVGRRTGDLRPLFLRFCFCGVFHRRVQPRGSQTLELKDKQKQGHLAGPVRKPCTHDLRVVSLSPTLGVELTF